jgi:hypothetical protein
MDGQSLRFKETFLAQFIPWILSCDITEDCLDLVDSEAGYKIKYYER